MLAAGAGGMYCGSCLRDNRLAATLRAQGRDVVLIPLYTPLTLDEPDASDGRVLFGGINVYLQQKYAFARRLPSALRRLFDAPALLRTAGRFAARVTPQETADLALSVLSGSDGPHAAQIEDVAAAVAALRPEVVILPDLLFIAFAAPIRRKLARKVGPARPPNGGTALRAAGSAGPAWPTDSPRLPLVACSLTGEDVFIDELPDAHRSAAFQHIQRQAGSVDLYLATSEYYAAHATRRFSLPAERVRVTPLGIDVSAFHAGDRGQDEPASADKPTSRDADRPFTIGYLARICKEKGLALLCDAFIRLNRAGRRCRLAIAGSIGPGAAAYAHACREQLARAGVAPLALWTLNPTHAEKAAFLRSLDVLSVPTAYPEAKGLYVLEALASGVPVVQPAHGSFPELLEATGGGLLFDALDPADLARKLALLMDDAALRRNLAAQGQAGVRARFTDHHMAAATWEALLAAARAGEPQVAT